MGIHPPMKSHAQSSRDQDFARLQAYVERLRREERDRLPSEPLLSEELGITRAKLRGMLKKLVKEGLIWRHVGKGTFIGERSLTNDLSAMPERLTPPEAFEARLVIEPQLAALAALRATPNQITDRRRCLAQMEQLTDFDQWAVWDERLHRLIAKAAGNQLLLAVYDTMRESAPSGMRNIITRAFSSSTRRESNHEHNRFIEAIADHDSSGAEAAVREHLLAVRQGLFGQI
jgi:DNA-binding FadR family transcriptional regulator